MITKMHIENFKCFKDFDIELGPFNVLIGPNDSGKTAFLQATKLVVASRHMGQLEPAAASAGIGASSLQSLVWAGAPSSVIKLLATIGGAGGTAPLSVAFRHGVIEQATFVDSPSGDWASRPDWEDAASAALPTEVRFFRFDPKSLRKPSLLSGDLEPDGAGFPTYLGKMLTKARSAFLALEAEFRQRFPWYTSINIEITQVVDMTTLADVPNGYRRDAYQLSFSNDLGATLPSESVSDGVMLSLAFLAVSHDPKPPGLLLVEEPENGVHHASLKDIVGTLKHLSEEKGVQVILTTHSPYLLDLVEPDQVRIFTKDAEGAVHATNMADAPHVQEMKKDFTTGEIWTCLSEERLVRGAGARK